MAKARALRVVEAQPGSINGTVTETWEVLYVGPDVQNGTDLDYVIVEDVDYGLPPAQISQIVASAIRVRAASIGRNVGTNDVLLASLIKG